MKKIIDGIVISAALLQLTCAHGDNPLSGGKYYPGNSHYLCGVVNDEAGKPVAGVGVHYLFTTEPYALFKTEKICPSTIIQYSIKKRGHVRIELFRWFTREFIGVLLDDTLNAGSYALRTDSLRLTSGVYIFTVETDSLVTEQRMIYPTMSYAEYATKIPLTVTDSSGRFNLPQGILGFGVPFPVRPSDLTLPGDTLYISPDIEILLYKEGHRLLTRKMTVDTTINMFPGFHMRR